MVPVLTLSRIYRQNGKVSPDVHHMLDTGYWLLVTGYWLLESGYWFLESGYWILESGYWILDTGYWILVTVYWILGPAAREPGEPWRKVAAVPTQPWRGDRPHVRYRPLGSPW